MSRSSVVLPVPLGPMTAVISPRRTCKVQAVEYGSAADRVAQAARLDDGFRGRRIHQAAWASIPGL